jgi:hypothetical protein
VWILRPRPLMGGTFDRFRPGPTEARPLRDETVVFPSACFDIRRRQVQCGARRHDCIELSLTGVLTSVAAASFRAFQSDLN